MLGLEVMLPRRLVGLGIDTLEYSTSEIRDVFRILSDENSFPLLVHCTQGKDRTGPVVLLVLMLCGVAQKALADDYGRSEKELLVGKDERLREFLRMGLSDDFNSCPADFPEEMTKPDQQEYGGMEKYLSRTGLTKERKIVSGESFQRYSINRGSEQTIYSCAIESGPFS